MDLKKLFETRRAVLVVNGKPRGVRRVSIPPLEELVGIERQKELLIKNTKLLLKGLPANDALLWGKRGTGKSSLVRAMLNLSKELKLLQVDRDDVEILFEFFDLAHELPHKFIVLIDDLSFEEETKEVRLLKTLLDGSVVERPPNVVIYATSNRSNLSPSTFVEREFKNPTEEVEERFSLADRFGLKIGFTDFSKEAYLKAVENYLKKYNAALTGGDWQREALSFAAERGFSGRSALQFARYYLAKTLGGLEDE